MKDYPLSKKLQILTQTARYDNSCSSSGARRETHPFGIGNTHLGGICHTWSADGRCVSLLKILLTNFCINNCKYCLCRRDKDIPRAILKPEELARLTLEFYRRNYIEGLFLSSGIYRHPDYTMELMLQTVKILRHKYLFNGYIHLKILPGTSRELIEEAFNLADRLSSNLELPTEESLRKLAPEKKLNQLRKPLEIVRELYEEKRKKAPASTQIIVGASGDSDKTILSLAQELYRKKMVRRVYYSAYIPVNQDKDLPALKEPPFLREHRLYQGDWLLRFYNFQLEELFEGEDNLPLEIDPKLAWALRHLEFFPIELSRASFEELIRVPGIGPVSARKIIQARKFGELSLETLKKLRVPLKRAKYFITIKGKPPLKISKKELIAFEKGQRELFKEIKPYGSLQFIPYTKPLYFVSWNYEDLSL
ncbi:MAG: putative DNA modification/repair radical SAM protein [Caldimicrobium sp.]|nr:putative DNA modification/repair radical SAM protein [Caldimicrobium sp.]MCX7873606.1 putative DNA modification/repair radical SAM protein [Caldimicrobium sp.]MDW8095068.1 putative DNA modification/repair radical SAM protein [Caldimicrobium sp.]